MTDTKTYQRRKAAKLCVKCGEPFPKVKNAVTCAPCKIKREANRKELIARRRANNECDKCGDPLPEDCNSPRCAACRARWCELHAQQRLKVFNLLGGPVCKGCGETEVEVLQLDHVNGDGAAHRKRLGGTNVKVYKELRDKPARRKDFRVLCANCNIRAYRKVPFPNERNENETRKETIESSETTKETEQTGNETTTTG